VHVFFNFIWNIMHNFSCNPTTESTWSASNPLEANVVDSAHRSAYAPENRSERVFASMVEFFISGPASTQAEEAAVCKPWH
jgi:hypothetical protein